MAKGFRHRFSISIYDKTPLDREIVEYIANLDNAHAKQEFIRSLIRAGFSAIVKNRTSQQAAVDGIDPETLAVALQTLSTLSPASVPPIAHQQSATPYYPPVQQQEAQQEAPQKPPKAEKSSNEHVDNNNSENKPDELAVPFESKIKVDDSKQIEPKIDPSTYSSDDNDIESRDLSETIDDDDIEDPMAMFGGEGGLL